MSVTDYTDLITRAAARYNVPAALIAGIIQAESQGNPNAVNLTGGDLTRGGSYGLMQMSADTAAALGFSGTTDDLLDPATNIDLGTHYLADLLAQTNGNIPAAVSGYNAGLSSVRTGDGQRVGNTGTDADLSTPFINQAYVDEVVGYMNNFVATFPGGATGLGVVGLVVLLGAVLLFRAVSR